MMCEEGHARRGQGVCVYSVVTRRERIHPGGGGRGVNKVVLLKVPRGSDPKEIISDFPIVIHLFFLKF